MCVTGYRPHWSLSRCVSFTMYHWTIWTTLEPNGWDHSFAMCVTPLPLHWLRPGLVEEEWRWVEGRGRGVEGPPVLPWRGGGGQVDSSCSLVDRSTVLAASHCDTSYDWAQIIPLLPLVSLVITVHFLLFENKTLTWTCLCKIFTIFTLKHCSCFGPNSITVVWWSTPFFDNGGARYFNHRLSGVTNILTVWVRSGDFLSASRRTVFCPLNLIPTAWRRY